MCFYVNKRVSRKEQKVKDLSQTSLKTVYSVVQEFVKAFKTGYCSHE